jgi:hypothetical protein
MILIKTPLTHRKSAMAKRRAAIEQDPTHFVLTQLAQSE